MRHASYRFFLVVALLAAAGCAQASEPPHWVSPTGAADWAQSARAKPLDGPAACSLVTANANARAGDTVYLRGGTYTTSLTPANNGTESARLTFQAYGKEKPRITGVQNAIALADRSYITVRGLTSDTVDRFLDVRRSHHNWFVDCIFTKANNTGGWPTGIMMVESSHHNVIKGISVGEVGYASPKPDDIGGVMVLGNWELADDHSDYNLIEDSTFYRGGHHIIEINGGHNILRNNYFHNENWMRFDRPQTKNLAGNRDLGFATDYPNNAAWNVVEGNRIAYAGESPDDLVGNSGVSLRTPHSIIRRNLFYGNLGPGLDYYVDGGDSYDVTAGHGYHNVFWHNGYTVLPTEGMDVRSTYGLVLDNVSGRPDKAIKGLAIKNNAFHQNRGGAFYFYHSNRADQTLAGNWEGPGDPLFKDLRGTPDVWNAHQYDFHLQAKSPLIDAGAFLTTTTSKGSGRLLPVADAAYFIDGYGIVPGDLIQLEGQKQTARIVSIDYTTNRLTLDKPLTWREGQGVALPYTGPRPDAGAFEYGGK
jgi:hypothetical protein